MSQRYDVWFCTCGHIHFMPFDILDWIEEDYMNRKAIQVCKSCGAVRETTLDPYEEGFCTCRDIYRDTELDCKITEGYTKLFVDNGVPVYLKNFDGSTVPASGKLGNRWFGINSKGNQEFNSVDTLRLIQDIKHNYREDADDILRSISGYVSGIDWSGTEYEIKY